MKLNDSRPQQADREPVFSRHLGALGAAAVYIIAPGVQHGQTTVAQQELAKHAVDKGRGLGSLGDLTGAQAARLAARGAAGEPDVDGPHALLELLAALLSLLGPHSVGW